MNMVQEDRNTELEQDLESFALAMDEKLRDAGSSSAERAFGIGCGLGLIPIGGIIIFLYIFQVLNIILVVLLGFLGVLFLTGFSALLASVARANTVRRIYTEDVQPEIEGYTQRNRISREQFDTQVAQMLPVGAPMQAYLSPVIPEQPGESVE